jgi:hypothetical protein
MDNNPILFIFPDDLLNICIETFNHIHADRVGTLASLTPIGYGFKRERASTQAAFGIII